MKHAYDISDYQPICEAIYGLTATTLLLNYTTKDSTQSTYTQAQSSKISPKN